MARNQNPDFFSILPEELLSTIVSCLPFKEAAKTSIFSNGWRRVWHRTKNIEFNENFFVVDGEIKPDMFIGFLRRWIENYPEPVINKFSLTYCEPRLYHEDMWNSILFALDKHVKVMEINFYDPYDDHDIVGPVFELPMEFYMYGEFESLQLFGCTLYGDKFTNFGFLKQLSLGYIELPASTLMPILDICGGLESLCLTMCWNIGSVFVTTPHLFLRSLIIERCTDFDSLSIEAPNLRFLKCSGRLCVINFRGWKRIEEADFNFVYGRLEEFDKFCCMFWPLNIKVLTIGSDLLKVYKFVGLFRVLMICSGDNPMRLALSPSSIIKHLILKTEIQENEFFGIKYFLNICLVLEMLTIDISHDNTSDKVNIISVISSDDPN
ncbi:hypothetical protein UlMin_003527 [Ulmus minor]